MMELKVTSWFYKQIDCLNQIWYYLVWKKRPVDFDDELKIGDVRYDNIIKITIKVQLFWRLPYMKHNYAKKWTISDLSPI